MATNATMTIRIDADLKRQAEAICEEMGLTISAAVTIFTKRLVKDRAIPFRVTAGDPFYSETIARQTSVIFVQLQSAWMLGNLSFMIRLRLRVANDSMLGRGSMG